MQNSIHVDLDDREGTSLIDSKENPSDIIINEGKNNFHQIVAEDAEHETVVKNAAISSGNSRNALKFETDNIQEVGLK